MTTLRGQVESVRLFRDSWGVMRLLAGSANERTQVVGTMLGFDEGDTIEVDGAFEPALRPPLRRCRSICAPGSWRRGSEEDRNDRCREP